MHTDAKSLRERGDRLFAKKRTLDARNQEIAEHFYPERADFTTPRDMGEDFAGHLSTGYPSLVRRDLGNSLGAMLRPRAESWFHMRAADERREDHAARQWLEYANGVQRRAMYDRISGFTRATKEGDHDFAGFGAAVLSVEMNRRDNALLYRSWHLRDVAWAEDFAGQVSEVHRNWKPTLAQASAIFGDKLHQRARQRLEKEPQAELRVRHVVIASDEYGDGRFRRFPFVSLFLDCEHNHVMEEVGSWTRRYVIPRWMTLAGSQYAYSPATVVALPDARLIQAMTLTLLEAGEKAVNPPMVGVGDAIRGELNIYAGGFTAVDAEYDERLGSVLRPLSADKNGLPFGMEMADRTGQMLREAFYLNTLSMPPSGGPEMTAFEVGQRVQEYIRQAMPIFEPMEADYNGALCEMTFDTLLREGAFGSPDQIPDSIRGADVTFQFESPLAEMVERKKGQAFLEAKAMVAAAAEADPDALMVMDFQATLRDVLSGIGAPAAWINAPEQVARMKAQRDAAQSSAQMLGEMQAGADVANTLGQAARNFAGADQ